MSCINCARSIEKALKKLNGITQATVNLAAEKALIEYNPTIIDQKTIEDTITEVGYQVIHEKISLQIAGMTCTNCAKAIEKALNAKEGIYSAAVNFATERVLVEYNSGQISLVSIKKAIQDVGYEVIEPQKTVEDSEGKARQRHIRRLKILLASSIAITIPIMLVMWFMPLSTMQQNNLLMFILATPVQFIVG
jgi:Cu+-exporting ATPase